MDKYNLLKLRNYLIHLVMSAVVLIFGASVLYSILSEMLHAYDVKSKYAYIFGIGACVLILALGLYLFSKIFGFESQVFRGLSLTQRQDFFEELNGEHALCFDRYLLVTEHFVMISVKSWNPRVSVLALDDLIGCFERPYYASSDELVQYDVILCDKKCHIYRCTMKGERSGMLKEGWQAICSYAPWVFKDDYMDFMAGLTKKSKKRSYLKIVEYRRQLDGYTGDEQDPETEDELVSGNIFEKISRMTQKLPKVTKRKKD